jgi:F-type H+-transporting ATPase subunit b
MLFVTPGYAQEAETPPTEGAPHTEHGGGHAPEGAGFPPFDSSTYPSQILWLVITFGLFYLFLKKVVLPRIGGVLEVRRDRIAQDLDQAARMKAEADAAVAAYEQELAEARAKASTIGQQARDAARADADAERKRIEASLDAKLDESEQRIAAIKAKALGEVGTIAVDTAEAIIQQLVGGKVDRAAIAAAVDSAKA